jgi:hypothetical protein
VARGDPREWNTGVTSIVAGEDQGCQGIECHRIGKVPTHVFGSFVPDIEEGIGLQVRRNGRGLESSSSLYLQGGQSIFGLG